MNFSAVDTFQTPQMEYVNITFRIFDFSFSTVSDFNSGMTRWAMWHFEVANYIAPFLCLMTE